MPASFAKTGKMPAPVNRILTAKVAQPQYISVKLAQTLAFHENKRQEPKCANEIGTQSLSNDAHKIGGGTGIHGGEEGRRGRGRMDKKAKITPGREEEKEAEGEQKARKEREKTKTSDQRFFAHGRR